VENHEAYVALNLLPGIGPVRVTQLLTVFGEPLRILAASGRELARVPGIGEQLAEVISGWERHCHLEEELALARKAGVQIITRAADAYPPLLREIHDPPLCLYLRGEVAALSRLDSSVAIVGSRHTTSYGVKIADNLATAAAVAGWVVVSGLARGIDTVAHEAVVRSHGCTIAVLGSGLGNVYPQENLALAHRICEAGGALVSEFPMMFPPDKRSFPMRNRVISGMTRGTVVVEAGSQSGSLITASQALDQGRQVFAVPGRVDSAQSRGCHALIKDGAKLVESFGDILEEFSCLPGLLVPPAEGRAENTAAAGHDGAGQSATADLHLTDLERKLLGLVGAGEVSIDALIAGLGEAPAKVLGALVSLEIRHLVRQLPGRRVSLRHKSAEG
jgi:DNA processing protein